MSYLESKSCTRFLSVIRVPGKDLAVCACVCMKHREGADVGETMTGLLLLHPFPVAL